MFKPFAALQNSYNASKSAIVRTAILCLLAVSLSSCGFHLRGNIPLSDGVKNMFVAAPKGTFKEALEDVLVKAGATLAETPKSADVVLTVRDAKTKRTVGTLDERGKVSSYKLSFSARYTLEGSSQEVLRKLTTVTESRTYDFDAEQVVESESEEAELLSSMEKDVALRVVRQLSAITDYQPK